MATHSGLALSPRGRLALALHPALATRRRLIRHERHLAPPQAVQVKRPMRTRSGKRISSATQSASNDTTPRGRTGDRCKRRGRPGRLQREERRGSEGRGAASRLSTGMGQLKEPRTGLNPIHRFQEPIGGSLQIRAKLSPPRSASLCQLQHLKGSGRQIGSNGCANATERRRQTDRCAPDFRRKQFIWIDPRQHLSAANENCICRK